MGLGERLRQVRGNKSQVEFGRIIGISQSSVGVYEGESRLPDSKVLTSICNAFEISPAWLLMGTGPMHAEEAASKTGDMSPVLPAPSTAQPVENIGSEENKTGDMSPVLEIQRELTGALKKGIAAQERIVELTEQIADLRLQLQERDMRIHELEKENAGLREAQKGSAALQHDAGWKAG